MNKQNDILPIRELIYISPKNIKLLKISEITISKVGEKAFGLSSLPLKWTLPFIVLSDELLSEFSQLVVNNRSVSSLIHKWCRLIEKALTEEIGNNIIIRSSGCLEGINQRGELISTQGAIKDLPVILENYLIELQKISCQKLIPLIIQKHISACNKGHLSNERRFSEDKRDWVGEFEDISTQNNKCFKIRLRNWRKKILLENFLSHSLVCEDFQKIRQNLEIPANWGTKKNQRIHYEWIWDEKNIYIVQADKASNTEGVNPKTQSCRCNSLENFSPQCLVGVNEELSSKYSKVRNVSIYQQLGLPVANIFILSDQEIINNLSKGKISKKLKNDISALVTQSLVIRMDIATKNIKERQLLPRTQEERQLDSAIEWLIRSSAAVLKETKKEIAFIFHNFIPAFASAFAYAAPNERNVQIEALWGLPEGLYYNAHDNYVVDTKKLYVDNLNVSSFDISRKLNYKHFFISPNDKGNWCPKILKRPFDWKDSIEQDEWIKEIALQSRKIANIENKPLSIMWFVDVPDSVCSKKVFPWHHEPFDYSITNRSLPRRKNSHKIFTIKTNADIEILKNEAVSPKHSIGLVHIQPEEDSLLRNKKLLQEIGELTKKNGAVILLDGAVLSHAFYQLIQTNAIVEISNPFEKFSYKRYFNKLVRDKIPNTIEAGGEIVNVGKLNNESLLKALKDKLIEEAFEVLEASEHEQLIEELADVKEVVDSIIHCIKVDKEKVTKKQEEKTNRAGSFKEGIILLGTDNPLNINTESLLWDGSQEIISKYDYNDITPSVEKNIDRRETPSIVESLITLDIPILCDSFSNTSKIKHSSKDDNSTEINITGKRSESKLKIGISICKPKTKYLQLHLPGFKDTPAE